MPRRKRTISTEERIAIWTMAFVLIAAGAARGHSVSVSRGTVVVEANTIRADLSIPIDDLLHAFRPEFDNQDRLRAEVLAGCLRRYELQLLKHFVIRDGQGRRISGRIKLATHSMAEAEEFDDSTLRAGRANYRLEYDLAEPPTYLTFQQTFFSDGQSHAAQLVLDVRVDADQPGCIVQLTNRGNAETVEVRWDDVQEVPLRVEAPTRFRTVTGQLSIERGEVRLSVAMPLALLETWSPVARRDPDFVGVDEWSAAKDGFARLFATRAVLLINGQPAAPVAISVELLSPDETTAGAAIGTRPISAWTAQIGATLEFATDSALRDVLVRWQLFNAAILDAEVTCVHGHQTTTHRLTPYEPTLRWAARNAGRKGD